MHLSKFIFNPFRFCTVQCCAIAKQCATLPWLRLAIAMPRYALPSPCDESHCIALASRRSASPRPRLTSAYLCYSVLFRCVAARHRALPLLCFTLLRPAVQFHCFVWKCRALPLPNATGLCSAFPLQNLQRFTLPLPNSSMLRLASACLSYSMPLLYSTPQCCTMPSHCFSSLHFALPSHSVQSSAMLSHSLLVFIAANHFSVFVKFFPDKSSFA